MSLVRIYEEFMENHADPRVKDWFCMGSTLTPIFFVLGYLYLIKKVLPAYMKVREPYNLTTVIKIYNIFQILANAILLIAFLSCGWLQGELSLGCQPIDYSDNPKAVRALEALYWAYLLKTIDLIETVFFILRKKFNQVSTLHVYHHASTVILAYVICKFVGGGMVMVPIMLNLLIHVFMYSYYYLASLGPEWQKRINPWKSTLTFMQMFQFTLILIHAISAFRPSCNVPLGFYVPFVLNILFLYKLFYDFYVTSYKKKTKPV